MPDHGGREINMPGIFTSLFVCSVTTGSVNAGLRSVCGNCIVAPISKELLVRDASIRHAGHRMR